MNEILLSIIMLCNQGTFCQFSKFGDQNYLYTYDQLRNSKPHFTACYQMPQLRRLKREECIKISHDFKGLDYRDR